MNKLQRIVFTQYAFVNMSINKLYVNTSLQTEIISRIRNFGPITISEYMKECLTNPQYGYYTNCDVFGKSGDFTTSPEICQVFGELIAVWFINEWKRQKCPKSVQFVEFGPGRGTLCADLVRILAQYPDIYSSLSVHLIEFSPFMRELQKKSLDRTFSYLSKVTQNIDLPPIVWHDTFESIPPKPSFMVFQEFLDAMPIHQFCKIDNKWHEILIDICSSSKRLRFVRAPHPTAAQIGYLSFVSDLDRRDFVEIAPSALNVIDKVSHRIAQFGGAALLIDYGHEGEKGNTLRGFSKHVVCDPLINPGCIDLTCDVDFKLICDVVRGCEAKVDIHGPVTQAYFLINMGLFTRLKTLISKCQSEEQRNDLFLAAKKLVTVEEMGERFKCMAITPQFVNSQDSSFTDLPGFVALPGTPYAQME